MDVETTGAIERLNENVVELRDELKRHMEVLHESHRGDIRVLAEGFATLNYTIDHLRR